MNLARAPPGGGLMGQAALPVVLFVVVDGTSVLTRYCFSAATVSRLMLIVYCIYLYESPVMLM